MQCLFKLEISALHCTVNSATELSECVKLDMSKGFAFILVIVTVLPYQQNKLLQSIICLLFRPTVYNNFCQKVRHHFGSS